MVYVDVLDVIVVFNVLDDDVPEEAQEVGARENYDNELQHLVELHEQKSFFDGVRAVVIVSEVSFELLVVEFFYDLLEFFYVEKLG